MGDSRRILGFILTVFVLVALLHSIVHVAVYGTGVGGIIEGGISGFSIGGADVGEQLSSAYPLEPFLSRGFLIGEWLMVGIFVTFFVVRRRFTRPIILQPVAPMLPQDMPAGGILTDLDRLYLLLRERKRLKLSIITGLFKIDSETALSWAMTLENAHLAKIQYPHFGEPELLFQ